MKRLFVLACAGLSFGLLASPIAAQEMAQAAPEAQQLPPPPPFPPMPSSKPSHRFVDVGGRHTSRARAKASPARHASSPKHGSKAHASSKTRTAHKARTSRKMQGSKAGANHRSVRKDKPMHFSAKTARSCHAMTYRQILRNSSCRSMIKQELAATATKARSSHKASAKHSSSRAKTARRHSTAKKRRR